VRGGGLTYLIDLSSDKGRGDCMTSWMVLHHLGKDGHLGWFLGWRVFRSESWHRSKPNISRRENTQ